MSQTREMCQKTMSNRGGGAEANSLIEARASIRTYTVLCIQQIVKKRPSLHHDDVSVLGDL